MGFLTIDELQRFAKWVVLVVFFLAAPAGTLYLATVILLSVSTNNSQELMRFLADRPLMLLCFYSGTVGSIVSYLYARLHMGMRKPSSIVRQISILLLGGIMGTAVFFVVRSGWILKLLYPNIPKEALDIDKLDYYSLIFLSVL